MISDRAHVVLPWHFEEDRLLDQLCSSGGEAIGTTMRGIGPCYRDKVGRSLAVRLGDTYRDDFPQQIGRIVEAKRRVLAGLGALSIEHSLVEATVAEPGSGALGRGVEVQQGAALTLASSALVENHEVALVAALEGTTVEVTDSLIATTLPQQSDLAFGRGVELFEGASVAFAIPGMLMGLATLIFWLGRNKFVRVPPKPGGRLGLLDTFSSVFLFMTVGSLSFTVG